MHTLVQDLRFALRTLRKNMMLTVVIVASLAIGIGANSAIFSVVDALLLRPLPYPQPDRLAAVWLHSPAIGILRDWPSPGEYIDVQNENHSFEQMALAQSRTFELTGREQPERTFGVRTQSSLLEMLGAKPLLGRLLLPEEDKPGKPDVAVLSERVWKRLFNADPRIVGPSRDELARQFFDVERFARDALLQRLALQQFHHDVGLAILLANLMNCADVGMVQRRRGPRLTLESFQCLPVFSQFFGEKLERDEAAQSGVFGLVDDA